MSDLTRMLAPEDREAKLPRWMKDKLRDLRYAVDALRDENDVLKRKPLEDPISRPGCRVEAMLHSPTMRGREPVLIPTPEVRFVTPNGIADVRVPVFDNERGIRVTMSGMVVCPEVSNVVQIYTP